MGHYPYPVYYRQEVGDPTKGVTDLIKYNGGSQFVRERDVGKVVENKDTLSNF